MALNVHPGYRGYAVIAGILGNGFRFSDANIAVKQEVLIPDMIMGDWDRDAYAYGQVSVNGSIAGPVTQSFADAGGILTWATNRDTCGEIDKHDVTLYYYCGGGTTSRSFTDMCVNSLNFSCAAGDIANFSIDVIAKAAGSWTGGYPSNLGTSGGPYQSEKIVTWDQVGASISGSGPGASALTNAAWSNVDFTISNNVEAVYAIESSATLFPYEIVPGLRTINGTLTLYDVAAVDGVNSWGGYSAGTTSTVTFTIGSLTLAIKCQLHRIEPTSSVGPITSTIGFTGVTHQSW